MTAVGEETVAGPSVEERKGGVLLTAEGRVNDAREGATLLAELMNEGGVNSGVVEKETRGRRPTTSRGEVKERRRRVRKRKRRGVI